MNLTTLDDSALVRCIADRDSDALNELYHRHQQRVFSTSLHLLGDSGLAEEITLGVFMSVWEQAATYDPDRAKVSTWLIMMTRRRSIDALRRNAARGEHQRADWAEAHQQPAAGSLEGTVESRLEQEQIRRAMAALPPDQADALALAFFQGYTHPEIAALLGEPLGTVKTRIRLALKKLRASLDNPQADSG